MINNPESKSERKPRHAPNEPGLSEQLRRALRKELAEKAKLIALPYEFNNLDDFIEYSMPRGKKDSIWTRCEHHEIYFNGKPFHMADIFLVLYNRMREIAHEKSKKKITDFASFNNESTFYLLQSQLDLAETSERREVYLLDGLGQTYERDKSIMIRGLKKGAFYDAHLRNKTFQEFEILSIKEKRIQKSQKDNSNID
jgi:hypothetical protein